MDFDSLKKTFGSRAVTSVFAVFAVFALLLLAGCASKIAPTPQGNASIESVLAPSQTVVINSTHFHPARVSIMKGQAVAWANKDSDSHDVEFEDGESSPVLKTGDSWSRVFNESGNYSYHCGIHALATGFLGEGTVVVS